MTKREGEPPLAGKSTTLQSGNYIHRPNGSERCCVCRCWVCFWRSVRVRVNVNHGCQNLTVL